MAVEAVQARSRRHLGDEMGLGKTVQVAAFLSVILGKTATSEDKQRVFPLEADDCRQVLIVVPSVTVTNWQRELSTWGYFRVKKAHGTDKADALRAAEARECEVVLTTYDALRIHLADFRRIDWHVTFWDEAHLLKNDKSERHKAAARIPCKRRYGLTGTPMSNKFVELWVLFNWVSNGGIGEKKHFESYYTRELGNGLKKNAKQWELAKRIKRQAELKDLNDQWMLQRFKSIIGHEMPKKLDHIVFCRLAAEQEEVYMRVLDSADYQQLLHMDDPCIAEGCGSGEPTKDCHPLNLEGSLAKWMHLDHEACQRCPSCLMFPAMQQLQKSPTTSRSSTPRRATTMPSSSAGKSSAEWPWVIRRKTYGETALSGPSRTRRTATWALRVLLKRWKAEGAKVLIFSYSTQMLDILEDFVTREAYSSQRLDGTTSTARRGKLVKDFNANPNRFIFLLSTKAGGLGINLTSANKVVVFDPNWNPSWDMQAQDRAYRIGQRKDVEVYRFIASNTIEEKVYQRQLYKHGQEGLALHQRDEARYFDGIMDDRSQQGELFGIHLLAFDRSGAGSLRLGHGRHCEGRPQGANDARLFSVERVGDSNAKRTEVDVAEDDDEERAGGRQGV